MIACELNAVVMLLLVASSFCAQPSALNTFRVRGDISGAADKSAIAVRKDIAALTSDETATIQILRRTTSSTYGLFMELTLRTRNLRTFAGLLKLNPDYEQGRAALLVDGGDEQIYRRTSFVKVLFGISWIVAVCFQLVLSALISVKAALAVAVIAIVPLLMLLKASLRAPKSF